MSNTIKGEIRLTNGQKMEFELYPDEAPLSVENFVNLAKSGFYDGLCFHRVIPDFMIQGGGFVSGGGKLTEKRSSKTVKGEFRSNGVENKIKHTKGVLSMARTNVKDSATSQFFICVATVPYLDGEYAGFGKLVGQESQAVADAISSVPTGNVQYYENVPKTPVEIQTIKIHA